ncbi:hypothetical protein, partial [Anaerospora sp.]|uniref:hypothetical protein n=1 Tax=Anaerospora sp. TaxID=1960278 RepID=UPI00289EFDEB
LSFADLLAEVRSGLSVCHTCEPEVYLQLSEKQIRSSDQSSQIRTVLYVLATLSLSFLALSTFSVCFNRESCVLSVFIITLTAFCVAFSHFSKVKPENGNFAKMAF